MLYNWKFDDHCEKLWQDIETFVEDEKSDSYFLVSIIINKDKELSVIDGQQRLTTFMLLLKALLLKINEVLEHIAKDDDAKVMRIALEHRRSEIINCLYVIDKDDVPLVVENILPLSELSIKYDNKSINETHPEEVRKILGGRNFGDIEFQVEKTPYKQKDNKYTNFFRNFKFFYEKINGFGESNVNKFTKRLLNDCQIIAIISHKTNEAIEIFNSLNSTGLPLTTADILSAELCSEFDDKSRFKELWRKVIDGTDKLSDRGIAHIDDILNQYMYILKAKTEMGNMSGIRNYFTNEQKGLLKTPEKFISDIIKIINIWLEEESSSQLKTFKHILLKHNVNFKFFYATYLYYNGDKPDEEKQTFAEALIKLFALLAITESGYSATRFKSFLFELNSDIGKGNSTNELVGKIECHNRVPYKRNF